MVQIEENKFKDWLETSYGNKNTRRQYGLAEKRFLNLVGEDNELDQRVIDRYIRSIMNKRNPFYKGFMKAYLECYDPEGDFKFKIPKDRSRYVEGHKEIKFREHEDILSFIETLDNKDDKLMKQISLMVRLYFETGLRAFELINIYVREGNKEAKHWGWNLHDRTLYGIGKGNKPFKVRFSKETAKLFYKHLLSLPVGRKPFALYKMNGEEYKNSYDKLIRVLKKECGITPHQIRHSLGHYLRVDLKWDIEQVRAKLRHKKIETTQVYTQATSQEIAEKEDKELFNDEEESEAVATPDTPTQIF